jgi:hypothetical protein
LATNGTGGSLGRKQTVETKPVTADDLDELSTHFIIFSEALAKFLVRLASR